MDCRTSDTYPGGTCTHEHNRRGAHYVIEIEGADLAGSAIGAFQKMDKKQYKGQFTFTIRKTYGIKVKEYYFPNLDLHNACARFAGDHLADAPGSTTDTRDTTPIRNFGVMSNSALRAKSVPRYGEHTL